MKKTQKRAIESDVVVDVICDLCGDSTKISGISSGCEEFSYGTLNFSGCYGSDHDLETVKMELCEACLFTIVRLRRSGVYISDGSHVPVGELPEDTLENILSKSLLK